MGICLDTEREQNGSQEFEVQGRDAWFSDNEGNFRYPNTPPEGLFPMQNGGKVKFEVPKVPVIFVLGGPGSGKVTHCDTLMQDRRGIIHINMTDLLQQYTVGNAEMKDFNQLSSKTMTEVLMLEMKMAPGAKTYLVSGYPRNMRDVVEYSNKIQIVNGVILVAWREKVLERQIDYGAKLGQVVLSLAKMELTNFYKNVMPVADYFDQRGLLSAVNGERNPSDVYNDFRAAVLRILGTNIDKSNATTNGIVHATPTTAVSVYKPPSKGYPPVIWVIGGPGSNKSSLCQKAIRQATGWVHLSVGRLLRAAAEVTDQSQSDDAEQIKTAITAGEMVEENVVLQLVETQILTNMNAHGILIDGFPRDVSQVHKFEEKFKQQPTVILLDCSKLQLGRGHLDDSIAAFRRRLEVFRELTLPMLKTLDNENRLSIVDGDTDTPQVQEEFNRIIHQHIEQIKKIDGMIVPDQHHMTGNGVIPNGNGVLMDDTQIHDLETEEDDTPAVKPVYMNGYGPPGVSHIGRSVAAYHQTNELNGGLFGGPTITDTRPSRDTIQNMYAQVDRYPMDSNI